MTRGPQPSSTGVVTARVAVLVAVLLPAAVAEQVAGVAAGMVAFVAMALVLVGVRVALPALAHGAFVRGELVAARRRYRALATLSWLQHRRVGAALSLAAVDLAGGRFDEARAALDALDEQTLDADARAVWLNNRAYARLRSGDPADGPALAEAAVELRPDVPAIRHTWGLALLAQGKLDAAIAALDELHRLAELPAALEAERCDDLALAWDKKGEPEYAKEYRQRAEQARRAAGIGEPRR